MLKVPTAASSSSLCSKPSSPCGSPTSVSLSAGITKPQLVVDDHTTTSRAILNYIPKQQEQQEPSEQRQSFVCVIPMRREPPENSSASPRRDPTALMDRAAARQGNMRPVVNSMNPLTRLFAPGSYFSPPCGRIGLAFCPSSPSAPALASHSTSSPSACRSALLSTTCSHGHGQIGADPNFQQQRQNMFSNLSGILQKQPQQPQQRSGSSSFFYPILNLLVATSTAVAIVVASSNASTLTSKGSEDDLPSPIYCSNTTDTTNKDNCDHDKKITTDNSSCEKELAETITTPVLNRPCSWNLMTHSSPEIHAMESRHHSKITLSSCMNSGSHQDRQSPMDSPPLDPQEKGYVLVATGSTSAHMLKSKGDDGVRHKRLKVSVDTKYARENEKDLEESDIPTSETLDPRYWQPSVSVEDFEPQTQIETENKVERIQQEYDVESSLGMISTIALSEWVVPTKLRILESQVEQEVSKLCKTVPPSKWSNSDTSNEDELVIQIDYDALLQTLEKDHQEQSCEKEQRQSNTIDDNADNSPYIQRIGQEDKADNGKGNLGNANALPHLKEVQFDDEVQVFEHLRSDSTSEDSSPRPQVENNVEGSDAIVSPSWKSFKVFGSECMGPVLDLSTLTPVPDIGRQQLPPLLDSSDLDMGIAAPVLTYDTVPPHLLPPLPPLLQSPSELTAPAKINTNSLPFSALPPHADAMQEQKQQQQYDPSSLKIPSSYPAPASSLQLQPLLKYVCLTLIVSASLISFSALLFGHQHHLHKAFHALSYDIVIDQDYPAVRHRQYLQGRLFEVDMEFDHMHPILQQVMTAMHSSFGGIFERLQHLEQRMTVRDLWTGYRLGGRTWS